MKKFTLLELLIVVAIIGILVSSLMPSLEKARQQSFSAVCKSNVKQIGLESTMYLRNNDDRFMFNYFGWDSAFDLIESRVIQCPADPQITLTWSNGWYGINNRDLWSGSPGGWFGGKSHSVSSKATDPVRFIMFGDSPKQVIDWAFINGWGIINRHPKLTHNAVMADGHVEAQNYVLTNSNTGNLVLKSSEL